MSIKNSLRNCSARHVAKLEILLKVLPVNKMDEQRRRFPTGVLLSSGCEFHEESCSFMQLVLTVSMLPVQAKLISVVVDPDLMQNLNISFKEDQNTRYFASL